MDEEFDIVQLIHNIRKFRTSDTKRLISLSESEDVVELKEVINIQDETRVKEVIQSIDLSDEVIFD